MSDTAKDTLTLREALEHVEHEIACIAQDLHDHEPGAVGQDAANLLARLCEQARDALVVVASEEPEWEYRVVRRRIDFDTGPSEPRYTPPADEQQAHRWLTFYRGGGWVAHIERRAKPGEWERLP